MKNIEEKILISEELFTEAIEKMDIQENETILDLYCGVGSIALQAAKRGANVIGIEIQKEAIQRAKENAKLNGMTNTRFFAEKAEERPDEILKKYNPKGVFVDPPRAGLDEKLIHALTESKVEKVVYVSCDPVTLIRDLSRFQESGWGIGEVVPYQYRLRFHRIPLSLDIFPYYLIYSIQKLYSLIFLIP